MRYRVRSRVLIDIAHDVEAENLEDARTVATQRAALLDERTREVTLHLINAEWRSNHDGLVRECLSQAWVECIVPDDPPVGMANLVSFRLSGGEHFCVWTQNILHDRLEHEGFLCSDRWTTGPHVTTFHLTRFAAELTEEMKARICAPIRYDDDPPYLEIT